MVCTTFFVVEIKDVDQPMESVGDERRINAFFGELIVLKWQFGLIKMIN